MREEILRDFDFFESEFSLEEDVSMADRRGGASGGDVVLNAAISELKRTCALRGVRRAPEGKTREAHAWH